LAGYLLGLEGFLFFFGIHADIFLLLMGVALATLFFAVRTTFRIRPANPFLIVLGGSAPLFAVLGLDNIFYVYRPLVLPHPVIVRLATAFGGLYCVIAAEKHGNRLPSKIYLIFSLPYPYGPRRNCSTRVRGYEKTTDSCFLWNIGALCIIKPARGRTGLPFACSTASETELIFIKYRWNTRSFFSAHQCHE